MPEERLELSRIAPEDFKSSASASSATPAQARLLYNEGVIASRRISLLSYLGVTDCFVAKFTPFASLRAGSEPAEGLLAMTSGELNKFLIFTC